MFPIISRTDDDALEAILAARAANEADDSFSEAMLRQLAIRRAIRAGDHQTAAYIDRQAAKRLAQPSDRELDELAFAEACEHVFRGRPSAIVGPIPR
jgi:hypothetical protein